MGIAQGSISAREGHGSFLKDNVIEGCATTLAKGHSEVVDIRHCREDAVGKVTIGLAGPQGHRVIGMAPGAQCKLSVEVAM
jgi:hypothetical protein